MLTIQILVDFYQRQKTRLAFIITSIIFFLLFYNLDLAQLKHDLEILTHKNYLLKREIQTLKIKIQKVNLLKNQAKTLNKKYNDILTQAPVNNDFASFLKIIDKTAKYSQVELSSIKPQVENNSSDFLVIPLSIAVIGSYTELANFISYLNQSQFLLVIKKFNIEPLANDIEDNKKVALNALIELYIIKIPANRSYLKQNKINLTNLHIKSLRDPFNLKTLNDKLIALTSWQIQELQMIGTITQDNKTWAIVRTPSGDAYHVTLGDMLGKNKSIINKISDSTIFTNNPNEILSITPN